MTVPLTMMTENDMTTRPPISLDGTVHWHRSVFLSNFRRCPPHSPTIFANLRVFILNFDRYVIIDDFQNEIVNRDFNLKIIDLRRL